MPRATYVSLALITGFYLVTTWAAISAYGLDKAQAGAQADPENFIFNASTTYLGQGFTDIMGILGDDQPLRGVPCLPLQHRPLPPSLWPATGCCRVRWPGLTPSTAHPSSRARCSSAYWSPWSWASRSRVSTPTSEWASASTGSASSASSPYRRPPARPSSASSSATEGTSPCGAASSPPRSAGLGLLAGLILMIINYPTLTGTDLTWVNAMPLALPVAAIAGAVMAGRQGSAHADEDHAAKQSDTLVS